MRRIRPRTLGCLLAGPLVLWQMAFAFKAQDKTKAEGQWPVFRGNMQQTGVAAAKLPDQLKVRWQFKAKDGIESTAAIAGGTVFIGSYDEHLHALDLKTGREKWKYKGAVFKTPVAFRAGAVYAGDEDGIFHCVDAATGKNRWTFDAGAEVTSGASFAGEASCSARATRRSTAWTPLARRNGRSRCRAARSTPPRPSRAATPSSPAATATCTSSIPQVARRRPPSSWPARSAPRGLWSATTSMSAP